MSTPESGASAAARGTVLVLGATSPIARALGLDLARRGHPLMLAGRDGPELERVAADVRARVPGARVLIARFDATVEASHAALLADLDSGVEGLVIATGALGDAERARRDGRYAAELTAANYAGLVRVVTVVADQLERQRRGFIVGLGSVAGDRGRQSNYVYGAAKGALALFLQGLRNRLTGQGVRVLTVKLGFVDTAMTWGMALPLPAIHPDDAADRVRRALDGGRDVVYVPGWWRVVMLIIRAIPEPIFKRLKL